MTKKQLGIICTLLALIVCTALLAAKLNNGGLNDPSDLSAALLTEDNNKTENEETSDKETLSQSDFFYEARSEREQKDAATVQSLKAITENANTTAEQKASATSELQKVTLKQDKQKTIELNLKNKGYDDALCEISDDQKQASVIVKTTNSVNEKEGAQIQEIVQNASNIKDVSIEVKK
jgi:stage III sporulation protein AH